VTAIQLRLLVTASKKVVKPSSLQRLLLESFDWPVKQCLKDYKNQKGDFA